MAQQNAHDTPAAFPYGATARYSQILTVEFDEGAGALPLPSVASVFDGHRWALSTRWDDSNPNALNIRRKMLENGIRGTFYLNSRKPETRETSLAARLTGEGECSVGGHSVSHPKLPELPANEAFRELLANRIALECLTDRPVNSLAFPYGQYQAEGRPEVIKGISECVLRTGYTHCVYSSFVTRNDHLPEGVVCTGLQVVPGDRQVNADKFRAHLAKIRKYEASYRKTSDCIFLGVHPWQKGEELEKLGRVMREVRDWDDFWHCTQTEWAAYTAQRRKTGISRDGAGRLTLDRPCAYDLGNDIPLTLVFETTGIRAVAVDGVPCPVRQADGRTIVNVPHARQVRTPAVIDRVVDGAAQRLTGLAMSLSFDAGNGTLTAEVRNQEQMPLTDAALTVALPPAFEPGLLRWRRDELAAGESWAVTATLTKARSGGYWEDGEAYAAATLDAVQGDRRVRLFAD